MLRQIPQQTPSRHALSPSKHGREGFKKQVEHRHARLPRDVNGTQDKQERTYEHPKLAGPQCVLVVVTFEFASECANRSCGHHREKRQKAQCGMPHGHEPQSRQGQAAEDLPRSHIFQQHQVSQSHKRQQVGEKLGQDSTVHKAVHGGVAEHATFGQEGGVQDEQKSQDAQVHRREQSGRLLLVSVDQQQVRRRHKHHPRHQRRVLHGVPSPKSPKAQGLVCPSTAHQDARPQDAHGEKGPRQHRLDPSGEVPAPERPDGVGEGNAARRKTKEQRRWMNGHPIVLKKWVESLSISELRKRRKVVCASGPRQSQVVGRFSQKQKWIEAKLEVPEVNSQQHDAEEGLNGAQHGHHFPLPRIGTAQDEQRQHVVPEHPKQESAFLSAPKCAQHKAHGHFVVQVLPDVLELIAMPKEQHENQGNDAQGAGGVCEECAATQGHVAAKERHSGEHGRRECQRHEASSKNCGPHPFAEVFHQASASSRWFCSLYFDGHFMSISVARK